MMRKRLYRNERATTGGRALARAAGLIVLNRGSTWRGRPQDVIVNWGTTEDHFGERVCRVINPQAAVLLAVDKLMTLQTLDKHEVPTPEWTTNCQTAEGWQEEDHVVFVRTRLRASGGDGILVVEPHEKLPPAPLYTQYFKARDEFRIHVIGGEVVDVQQKRRRLDDEGNQNANNAVRNLENGCVFCREEVQAPELAQDAAVRAVRALGLDFGAVDLKVNRQETRVGVLEVNTAPGLEGTSLDIYARGIRRLIG